MRPNDENGRNTTNLLLLKVLQKCLRLSNSAIARAGGVSSAYITRIKNGDLNPGDSFWASLNENILKEARSDVFRLSINIPDNHEQILEQLTSCTIHQEKIA